MVTFWCVDIESFIHPLFFKMFSRSKVNNFGNMVSSCLTSSFIGIEMEHPLAFISVEVLYKLSIMIVYPAVI